MNDFVESGNIESELAWMREVAEQLGPLYEIGIRKEYQWIFESDNREMIEEQLHSISDSLELLTREYYSLNQSSALEFIVGRIQYLEYAVREHLESL